VVIERLFIYLTPFIPLSFKGEGEGYRKRGAAPLRHPLKRLDSDQAKC